MKKRYRRKVGHFADRAGQNVKKRDCPAEKSTYDAHP